MRLRLDNIQGNIIPGFRSDHQAFMFVRLTERQRAREWVKELLPRISSAREIAGFLVERRHSSRKSGVTNPVWINIAFSRVGLQRLGAASLRAFPDDFYQGLYARADQTGDNPREINGWEVGGSRDTEAHAVLLIGAKTSDDLDREWKTETNRLQAHGCAEIKTYRGQRLPGGLRDHEHFGFRDGVSQPDPRDLLAGWSATEQTPAPGEFILGYPDDVGAGKSVRPPWARDGSYLVFRRLRQDVFRFRQTVSKEARRLSLQPDQLSAKLLGRWRSGAKLGDARTDPGWRAKSAAISRLDFVKDPDGQTCPRFAHIRKANPRDVLREQPQRHRLIRRGIPYGPPLAPDASSDDGQDRGLIFLAYQASLFRQFEHVQHRWLNNANFPRQRDGPDPLVGETTGSRSVKLRQRGGRTATLALQQFVSVTAGGYFFAPSIQALRQLARSSNHQGDEEGTAMPYEDAFRDLGEFIFEENPYTPQGQLRVGFQSVSQIDDEGHRWEFLGSQLKIRKAIRIPYRYRDTDGEVKTETLLIGYAGGSD